MKQSQIYTFAHPLVSVLLSDNREDALNSWNAWTDSIDFDEISYAELSLLPAIYLKWKDHREFAFDDRMQGIARKFFYQNTLYEQAFGELCSTFDQRGLHYRPVFESLLQTILPGTGGHGRICQQIEIWLHRADTVSGLEAITACGWQYTGHNRTRMTFTRNPGQHLTIYFTLLRHWTERQRAHYFRTSEHDAHRRLIAVVNILLAKFTMPGFTDLQGIIDFSILIRSLDTGERRTLDDVCGFYALDTRLQSALAGTGFRHDFHTDGNDDPAQTLDALHATWLENRTRNHKIRYHLERYYRMYRTQRFSIRGYYRYWRMLRDENRQINSCLNQIHNFLRTQ